ncbi:MAG: hypothetical protein IJY70_02320 [Clostridia bacterium]|nr:hypothetical protein [Clostridia bacterium]
MKKIKVKVSSFVSNILENDALRFGFTKNDKSNKNALLNKLIPTLVAVKKFRRSETERILKDEYGNKNAESIFNAVNTINDSVFFKDEELNELDEFIWIRPSKNQMATFDEIESSETKITAKETSVYIRDLLNEYSRLPQYKREVLVFDEELDNFSHACVSHCIFNYRDRWTGEKHKVFAYNYYYGYLYVQVNVCVVYDLNDKTIRAVPLSQMGDTYFVAQKYKPSYELVEQLQLYGQNHRFDEEVVYEGE